MIPTEGDVSSWLESAIVPYFFPALAQRINPCEMSI